jgi:TonB family protein
VDDRHFPDDLPLRPVDPKADGPAWDLSGERPDARLEFDPLEEEGEPALPPPGPGPRKPPSLRIALSVAALIALVLFSRDFWWPEEPEAPKAAPKWVAAPHLPAEAVPPPEEAEEPPIVEEEAPEPEMPEAPPAADDDEYEILQTEELAGREEIPEPLAPPQEEDEIAAAEPAPSPEDDPPPARRTLPPAPWETGEQPTGLLRPGPGVQQPVPLDLPRYRYPPAARGTGLQVGVRLALLVDERGRVIDAVVREGGPEDLGFNQEALRVARNIPFQPASRHDVPGKMWTEMILEFSE